MYLFEIFSVEHPGKWQEHGRFRFRQFEVDGKTYVAQIEHKLLPGAVRGSEVSFFRSDVDGADASFSTTADQPFSLQVYSYLFGMIQPLYRETGETLFFTAELRHSHGIQKTQMKKSRIYKRSVEHLASREGGLVYVSRSRREQEILLTKTPLKHDHKYWVNERNEALVQAGLKPIEKL